MGERKVLNKYIPADFDPKLVPRGKRPKDELVSVRMMLPFTVQCSTCSTFMYRGKKFNSKKEPMRGPDSKYLGIQRYRLYQKCSGCSRPFTFLTDPKNADYEMESGGTRNYEVWHDKEKTEKDIAEEKETEEKLDPMKALENRILDSQRQMENLDNLDEIKAMNMRHKQLMSGSIQDLLDRNDATTTTADTTKEEELNDNGLTAEEEELVKSLKFGTKNKNLEEGSNIIRIKDNEDDDEDILGLKNRKESRVRSESSVLSEDESKRKNASVTTTLPGIKIKRKRKAVGKSTSQKKKQTGSSSVARKVAVTEQQNNSEKVRNSADEGAVLSGLLGGYGSDSDSDSD